MIAHRLRKTTENTNPGQLSEKSKRYLCAMLPPNTLASKPLLRKGSNQRIYPSHSSLQFGADNKGDMKWKVNKTIDSRLDQPNWIKTQSRLKLEKRSGDKAGSKVTFTSLGLAQAKNGLVPLLI